MKLILKMAMGATRMMTAKTVIEMIMKVMKSDFSESQGKGEGGCSDRPFRQAPSIRATLPNDGGLFN